MLRNSRKKVAVKPEIEIIKEDKNKPGVIVGPAYEFLFEGEDNKNDDKYADYI